MKECLIQKQLISYFLFLKIPGFGGVFIYLFIFLQRTGVDVKGRKEESFYAFPPSEYISYMQATKYISRLLHVQGVCELTHQQNNFLSL